MSTPQPVTFVVASTAQIARDKVIPALNSVDGISLIGVSSRDRDRAGAFAAKHNAGKGMTHDDVLKSSNVDAVYVPLPSGVRNGFMTLLLESGKHVYSEKPHSGTVSEFKAVLDLAARKGLQWMDGTMWYHSHRTKVMEKKLKEMGRVCRVSASFTWGNGLVDQAWIDGGNGRTDPTKEPFGMLGDSGHYPITVALWAFAWQNPVKVQALHTKHNKVGALITTEAYLWFADGGRAIIDASCECPHRSQFEIVCDNGVIKVDDLVAGQGRSGNFGAYEGPFVGSSSFVLGDQLGKDVVVEVEPCDHVQCLVEAFKECVIQIRDMSGTPDADWSRRALRSHTVMCCIFESAMRGGAVVEISNDGKFLVGGETFDDMPSQKWDAQIFAQK